MAVLASATPIVFSTLNTCARSFSHSKSTTTRRRVSSLRASSSPLEVCVKESINVPGKLGDCPFSQRILLTLEEKHLGYDMKLINTANKPEWFLAVNPQGKVPVIKLEGKWIADSDVIAQSLEEKYPDRALATPPEKASVGSGIFSAFIGFLKSKDPTDGTQEALIKELTLLDDHIKQYGPFINGTMISAADLSLGPKLYHMKIALGHYKKWSPPESLMNANSYIQSFFSRESFIKTRALPEDVIAGWSSKVQT